MTKTERFKLNADRAAQGKKPKRKPRTTPPRTERSKQARRALLVRSDGPGAKVPHNTALRRTKGPAYELEAAKTGATPRLSTRKSRLKPDNALRIRATDRTTSPGARASRRSRSGRR